MTKLTVIKQKPIGLKVQLATVDGSQIPHYTGDYTIEPRMDVDITLNTQGKQMNQDVCVLKVLQLRVDNEAGGQTLTIGR